MLPLHSVQLAQFFAASPGTEIVADAPRNRVLVRGDEETLRQAGELLAKLDPPAAPAPPPVAKLPVQQLEAYALTPASQIILTALEKQAAGRPDIRVAVDERSSQVLVLAPDTVHTQIREKLAQAATPQAAPQPAAVPMPQSNDADESNQFSAASAAPEYPAAAAESAGRRFAGAARAAARDGPCRASTDSSGQWQTFEIEAVPGAGVTATVNPTTGQLHLSGPANRTSAWQQVISALDSGPLAEGTVTQLVSTKPANHERVRQVLEAVQAQNASQGGTVPGRMAAMLQQQTPEGAAPAESAGSTFERGRGRPGSRARCADGDRRGESCAGGGRAAWVPCRSNSSKVST